jgi:hypothetical protein
MLRVLQGRTGPFALSPEEVAHERERRLAIAKVLLAIDEEYDPDYDSEADLDPTNLPGGQEQLGQYRKIANVPSQPQGLWK